MAKGSSPRVRGRLALQLALRQHGGLIPACAGQTTPQYASEYGCWAHPRVCGADCGTLLVRASVLGLIPACAGQTFQGFPWVDSQGAHPRVCGADISGSAAPKGRRGSSPRVRGRPDRADR